jgi:phospholipid-binding lipoprotein MlaA
MRYLAPLIRWSLLAAVLVLQGCASVPNPDRRDPLESFNRSMFGFNEALDTAIVKPVATGYKAVTPSWFRTGVGNFFSNLGDVWSIVNNALQLRGDATGNSIARVLVNTSVGLGGLIDVASDLNIDRHPADFGLTLGRWGVPTGPYLVLPLLGPSTLRNVGAMPVDNKGNLVNQIEDESTRTGLTVLNGVNTRASYLQASDVVDGAALDKYSFFRDAYLQRLRNRVYDGNPPEEDEPDTTEAVAEVPAQAASVPVP